MTVQKIIPFMALAISTCVLLMACGDESDDGDDNTMATGAVGPMSAGDLCPNKTASFEACVGGAQCSCINGSYYSTTSVCTDDEYNGCTPDVVGNMDEACEIAVDSVPDPPDCETMDMNEILCRQSGVTGPDTVQAGGCCTATLVRGCDLIPVQGRGASMRD